MAGPTCEFVKRGGERCRARPRAGSAFCFFHDPTAAGERRAARRRGGITRSRRAAVLPETEPDAPLNTVADVVSLLGVTINQTRRGQLDVKVANALSSLTNVLLRGISQGDLEQRLAAVEARLAAGEGERTP
jgi:hypothetical protein